MNTTTTDPRPFMRHMALAQVWCQWKGQKGTEKQVLKVMRQLTAPDLIRMLGKRRVVLPDWVTADAA